MLGRIQNDLFDVGADLASPEEENPAYPPLRIVQAQVDRLESEIDAPEAELATLAFLREWVDEGASPMCGNSICQDRRFLAREMPQLEAYFHYRNLDVSTLKILAAQWAPAVANGFDKESAHLALSDIRDSIDELAWYRDHRLNPDVLEGGHD